MCWFFRNRKYDCFDIAEEFLRLAKKDKKSFTPMQIIRIVYIAHGWCLALKDKALIYNEIEAWRYGPVIPDLYHSVKIWGYKPITKNVTEDSNNNIDEDAMDIIRQTYDSYGDKDALELRDLTYKDGTVWDTVYSSGCLIIPNDLLKSHYFYLYQNRITSDMNIV